MYSSAFIAHLAESYYFLASPTVLRLNDSIQDLREHQDLVGGKLWDISGPGFSGKFGGQSAKFGHIRGSDLNDCERV